MLNLTELIFYYTTQKIDLVAVTNIVKNRRSQQVTLQRRNISFEEDLILLKKLTNQKINMFTSIFVEKTTSNMKMSNTCISKIMISLFMTLMLASSSVLGATIRAPTVDNPCQIDPTSTGPQEFQPMDQQIDDTITAANLVSTKADAVKQAMVPIFVTPDVAAILDQPSNNLPGLPLTLDGGSGTSSNIVNVTKQAYNDLSSYIFYLQMALTQQMAYDSAVLVSEIKETVDSSFSLLCKFDTILRSQGIQLTEFVDSSVVRQDIEGMGSDSATRYQRDYVLMKNANQYVKSVAYTFVELKETL